MAQGRIKRLRSATLIEEKQAVVSELYICALCDREIPPALRDAHHLIPKSKGGCCNSPDAPCMSQTNSRFVYRDRVGKKIFKRRST